MSYFQWELYGLHSRGRAALPCVPVQQQGRAEALPGATGRMVVAAASGMKVCLQAGTSVPMPKGKMVVQRVRSAPPEGESSSLAPPLCQGAPGGALPLMKQHLFCAPGRCTHTLSADLVQVPRGDEELCKSVKASYF